MNGKKRIFLFLAPAAGVLTLLPSLVYKGGGGESCTRCHEIRPTYDQWAGSAHRNIPCEDCHGGVLTADMEFHAGNLRRLVRHWRGEAPAEIRLVRWQDLERVMERCKSCHQQEYASWRAGPHSASYADLFLDETHNTRRLLMDDCLRCHGMHFPGSIGDLVEPLSTTGPWRLKADGLAAKPAIPCLACHEIHRPGEPRPARVPPSERTTESESDMTPSLGLLDRRTEIHLAAAAMPLPAMYDRGRAIAISPDPRQALCYQCHAARADGEAGSGDDRTAHGVHEGISCLACHAGHAMETRASCAVCHPRFSNCGMDIEKMNVLLRDPRSRFDVHSVACKDCHPKGVPARRNIREEAADD